MCTGDYKSSQGEPLDGIDQCYKMKLLSLYSHALEEH